jgi:hypothetical protein
MERWFPALALGGTVAMTLVACGAPAEPVAEVDVQATVLLTAAPPAATSEPTVAAPSAMAVPALSFEAATYRNVSAGFEFDYPAGWAVGPDEQYSRGGITAFSSWARPTDAFPGATPPGETRLDVTVQLWDPKGDLKAFLDQRQSAWDGSGISVISQERWNLADGREAAAFVVQGSDGAQGFFFFTTIGDRYLVLSGDGTLALLAEIAHTVRPTPLEY